MQVEWVESVRSICLGLVSAGSIEYRNSPPKSVVNKIRPTPPAIGSVVGRGLGVAEGVAPIVGLSIGAKGVDNVVVGLGVAVDRGVVDGV